MRYWWVNQNQTYRQEVHGGYMWSPKRRSDGARHPFYEFMREVAPGDLVFSFAKTLIPAIGVARSVAYEAPKPPEFGSAGPNWSDIGWRVDVYFKELDVRVKPAEHIDRIAPHLPPRYSPLSKSGSGFQSVYLTVLPPAVADILIDLIGQEAREAQEIVNDESFRARDTAVGLVEWENHLTNMFEQDQSIADTERRAVILARRGQGRFKEAVMRVEERCRLTGVDRKEHLRASHIKPWRDCESHQERLDGENGFLMTPTVDHLFDRGFISFENDGELLVSGVAHPDSMRRMGIALDERLNVGTFSEFQRRNLEYHRDEIFLHARVRR